MSGGTLRSPVRNLPTRGDRHVCTLIGVLDDGSEIDLTNESVCRAANLQNGMIFTDQTLVIVGGKQQPCGKEWVLHYPTVFAWKPRRGAKPEDEPVASNVAQPGAEAAAEAPAKGRGKH